MIVSRRTLLLCLQLEFYFAVAWTARAAQPFGAPEVASYAKVSKNGNVTSDQAISQARGFHGVTISRSPVYVPAKTSKLRNGEAVDHPSTVKYSTLDREAVAKLETLRTKQQAQDRFNPPASFEHVVAHGNAVRQQVGSSPSASSSSSSSTNPAFPVPDYATLPRDAYSQSYSFQQEKPVNDPPPPVPSDDFSNDSEDSFSKIPDSYRQPEMYSTNTGADIPKFSSFPPSSSYGDKYPPKPMAFPDHYPTFVDDSYLNHHHHHHSHDDQEYPHDLIYDHPPDHFHDHPTTTEEPEMNDQRLSKRPYSYYYIGKKLWYLPLYFSIYFIIYIAALVLKSITRHKINFPANLAAATAGDARHENDWEAPSWFGITKRVLDGIDAYNSIGKTNPE